MFEPSNFDAEVDDSNDDEEFKPTGDPVLDFRMPSSDGRMMNVLEAAEKGELDLLKKFYKIDPKLINYQDSDGYTPLHRACYNNHIDTVKWLIEHGANVRARTNDGWEPIHSAAQWGHARIFRILAAFGANINAKTNGGNTPFHLACTRGDKNRSLIEYLLFSKDSIDLDAKNDAGDTAFDICKRNSMLYKLWDLL